MPGVDDRTLTASVVALHLLSTRHLTSKGSSRLKSFTTTLHVATLVPFRSSHPPWRRPIAAPESANSGVINYPASTNLFTHMEGKFIANIRLKEHLCFSVYSAWGAINRAYKPVPDALDLKYKKYIISVALWEQDN